MKYPDFPNIKVRNIRSKFNDLVFHYKEGGKRKTFTIKDFPWYFVMETQEVKKHNKKIKYLKDLGKIKKLEFANDKKYIKLYADKEGGKKDSNAMQAIEMLEAEGAKLLEADFYSAKRFLMDYDVELDDEYDILYFDIETDDTNSKIVIGGSRILSIAAINSKGKIYYNDDENEEALLDWAAKLFVKYDVVAGWNIKETWAMGVQLSSGFDLPYIVKRYEKYNKKFPIWDYGSIDMLARSRRLFKDDSDIKSYSLENIAQHFLKKGKVERKGKVIDLYTNDRKKFKEYNIQDVKLLKELDEQLGIISLIGKQCQMSKTLIRDFDGINVAKPLDNLIIQKAHERGIYVPSKRYKLNSQAAESDIPSVSFAGGYVYEPKVGLHSQVYVFDFKSLYPSIIMTSNVGFDTLLREDPPQTEFLINPGTNLRFAKDRKSVVAEAAEFLIEARQSYKKRRLELTAQGKTKTEEYSTVKSQEIIIKEFSNSMYGVLGNKYVRWYSVETAESITKMGQYLLKWTYNWFNQNGGESIYGDTDSVFVKFANLVDVEVLLKEYHEDLKLHLLSYRITDSVIELKYEKLFDNIVMVEKKNYAGYVSNIEGKAVNVFDAKGIEIRKKGTTAYVAELQKTIIDLVITTKGPEEIAKYMWAKEREFLTRDFTFDEIKTTRNVGKPMDEYKQAEIFKPHVEIAKRIIERNGALESKEIEYVYVSHKGRILVERHEYTGVFDRRHLWNTAIINPVLRILEAAYPKVEWQKQFKIYAKDTIMEIQNGQKELF